MISPRLFKDIRIVNRPCLENVWLLDRACLSITMEMERVGMRIDRGHVVKLHTRITDEMEDLATKVAKMVGRRINLGSGDQLAELLFDEMHLRQPGKEKWTKSRKRLAVDADVLKGMVAQHGCIKPILDWKEREKLRSTYTYSLISQADENDRIHSDLSTTTAETGRLASSDPNLQNIPVRTTLGQEVRKAFIPKEGNVMGTVDASQIEMRCHAHDSQCQNMMEIFWTWEDLYWATAELMYKRKFSPDDRKHGIEPTTGLSFKEYYRFNAKTTTLGVSYDISPPGLVDQFLVSGAISFLTGGESLVWDPDKYLDSATSLCGAAIMDWFGVYPEILIRRKQHHKRAMRYRMVWDMWGRVRMIPQVMSQFGWVQGEGLRQAGNMPIQGAAAGIIKLWMAKVWERWVEYWSKYGILILMQIHDELLSEGPPSVMVDFLEECKHLLRNLIPVDFFTVPIEGSSAIADNWGDLEK